MINKEKIEDWIYRRKSQVSETYHTLKYGFGNLIEWFPLVWKDRYYDFNYTYEVLLFKIEQQKRWWTKNKRHVGWKDDVKKMDECINILKKLINDQYDNDFWDLHQKKWGEVIVTHIPSKSLPECSEIHISSSKATTKKLKQKERNEFRKNIDVARKQKIEARTKMFTILAEHIENWWD